MLAIVASVILLVGIVVAASQAETGTENESSGQGGSTLETLSRTGGRTCRGAFWGSLDGLRYTPSEFGSVKRARDLYGNGVWYCAVPIQAANGRLATAYPCWDEEKLFMYNAFGSVLSDCINNLYRVG